jgi:hypothetical protein
MPEMPTDGVDVVMRVTVKNHRSLRAFWRACDLVGNAAEDYPWSDDLREAMQCLVRAGRGLGFQTKNPLRRR